MLNQARFASFVFASFIALCTACATPVDEEDGPAATEQPVAVDAPEVSPQAGNSVVILGEPTIKTCVNKCEKFCKKMPSGRTVCGETCICVFN